MSDEKIILRQKEIYAMFKEFKFRGDMTLDEALSAANEIVEKINKLIATYKLDKRTRIDLYENAKDAYIMAAQKVPEEDKIRVLRPSSFWSLRADIVRLERPDPVLKL